jgi:hypothetical protein
MVNFDQLLEVHRHPKEWPAIHSQELISPTDGETFVNPATLFPTRKVSAVVYAVCKRRHLEGYPEVPAPLPMDSIQRHPQLVRCYQTERT